MIRLGNTSDSQLLSLFTLCLIGGTLIVFSGCDTGTYKQRLNEKTTNAPAAQPVEQPNDEPASEDVEPADETDAPESE